MKRALLSLAIATVLLTGCATSRKQCACTDQETTQVIPHPATLEELVKVECYLLQQQVLYLRKQSIGLLPSDPRSVTLKEQKKAIAKEQELKMDAFRGVLKYGPGEQHGGRVSSKGAPSAPPNEPSP